MKFEDLLKREMGAVLSPCGSYRYLLTRRWDDAGPMACFVMLNPSTADADRDDPTIRRCISFAEQWDCASLAVVNLFAYRATEPDALKEVEDPVGPQNDLYIKRLLNEEPEYVVCAWGAFKFAKRRVARVLSLIREQGLTPVCLGMTAGGGPRHPLYVERGIGYRIYHGE